MATRIVTFLGINDYQSVRYGDASYTTPEPIRLHDLWTLRTAIAREGKADAVSLIVLGTEDVKKAWFGEGNLRTLPDGKTLGVQGPDAYWNGLGGERPTHLAFIELPQGSEPEERWDIFNQMCRLLDPEPLRLSLPHTDGSHASTEPAPADRIIVDITHGFRSQPFFATAAVIFAQAQQRRSWGPPRAHPMPQVQVLYFAFEARKPLKAPSEQATAPVWDMTQFLDVLRWNGALDDLMRHGRADDLSALLNEVDPPPTPPEGEPTPLQAFREAAVQFADGLASAQVPLVITKLARKLREGAEHLQAAMTKNQFLGYLASPLEQALKGIQSEVAQLEAPEAIGEVGNRAVAQLGRLYRRLQRYSELSSLLRELQVSRLTVSWRKPEEILQPGQGTHFSKQREEDEKHIGDVPPKRKGVAPPSPAEEPPPARRTATFPRLREQFKTIRLLRNPVQHCGFQPELKNGRDIITQVSAFLDTEAQ